MESFTDTLQSYWEQARTLAAAVAPEYWAIGGTVLVLLLLWRIASAQSKKRKRSAIVPKLMIEGFQIAPLGRDAFLKIRNTGEPVTFSALQIKGRVDVAVKNVLAGHELETDKSYSLLLEATGQEKITPNFSIELTYLDRGGNVYIQRFRTDTLAAGKAKLIPRR
ncbi:MAG: hypothetical protein HUU01_07400 [Saprospiraceae bacterium]|nr:hypothetical protein [Saprospiraceae bacterium]